MPEAVDPAAPTDARAFNLWSKKVLGGYEKLMEMYVELATCLEEHRQKGIIR